MNNTTNDNKIKLRWIVICLCFAGFISTLDDYIVNISLPTIAQDFNATTSEVSRVTLAYLMVLTGSLLLFGKLGDKLGFKKIFISGYIIFTISSFLCGISSNLNMLVIFRCIQGIGASMLSVMSPAIIARFIPLEIKGWAFGILTTVCALGITLGAPVGGIITGYLNWHWIFFINVPTGIIAIFLSYKFIPDEKGQFKEKGLDYLGVILSFLSLFLLIYALNIGEESGGWTSPFILTFFIASIVSFLFFIYREKKISYPLINLDVFKNLDFTFANISTLMAFMLLAGCNFLLPFYLAFCMGLTPAGTGFIMLIYSVVYASISPYMGSLSDKIHPRILCSAGMLSATGACLFFSFTLKYRSLTFVIIYLIWRALSYGMFISPNNKLVMSLSPEGKQGITSSVLKVATNLSLVLGVCFFETIFSLPVPENMGSLHNITEHLKVSPEVMYSGFHDTYIFGAVICFMAFLFAVVGSKIK